MGLVKALKRRWVLASFLGLLVGLAASAGVWLAFPTGKHVVRALIEMSPDAGVIERNAYDNNFEGYKKNQEVLIKTRGMLARVVKSRQVSELALIKGQEDPAKWIEDQIQLKWVAPDVVSVSMNGDNPDQLRIILDAVISEYVKDANTTQKKDRMDRVQLLEKAKEEIQDQIHRFEWLIQSRSKEGLTIGTEGTAALQARLQNQLTQCDTRIDELTAKIREYEARIREAETRQKTIEIAPIPQIVLDQELEKNTSIKAMREDVDLQRASLSELMDRLNDPTSPLINSRKERLAEAERKLNIAREAERESAEKRLRAESVRQVEETISETRQSLNIDKGVLEGYTKMRQDLEDRSQKVAMKGNAITLDADTLKPLRDQYAYIQKQILDLNLIAKAGNGRVNVREDATIIMNYNLKQKMMFSTAVAVVGFLAIIVLVAYLEWCSRRVDSVDQVVSELGMRVIGTIPAFPSRASLKAGEADQNQNWRFILNESVNSTRTMLLHTAKTQSMQVIMVTSAMQGEGKTSLASQLGTSMATAGLRTLILDFDLRNPSMHRLFDVPISPGSSEIICSEVDVSDAVQPTTVPNLWIIPAGQCSNRVVSALAQGHPLETLFNRLRGQFDFIVVDTCPILPVADALLVGQHVDGAVISILQDISQLPKVLNASERLTQLNIPLLGAVVNGIKTDVHAYGYNYVKQLPA